MAFEESRNKSVVAAQPVQTRQRLLSAQRIAAFSLLIVGAMALLYPHDKLIEQVTELHGNDALSRAYLDNLLDKDPDNAPLRLARFEADLQDGHLTEAEHILQDLAKHASPDIRLAAARALLRLRERQLHTLRVGSAPHARARLAYHQSLAALAAYPLDYQERQALAEQAAAAGAYPLAMRIYRDFSLAEPAAASRWIDRAAQLGLGHRRYREVAALYFDARQRATHADTQRDFYLKGIAALRAGNLGAEALAAAEKHLGNFADDPTILLHLVNLARAANRNDRAEFYVRQLLHYARLGRPLHLAQHDRGLQPVSDTLTGYNFSHTRAAGTLRSDALDLSTHAPVCTSSVQTKHLCWQRLAGYAPLRRHPALRNVNGSPQLPFDDAIYRLGYDVFLGNRNLRDAYAVAQAAVRQVPDRADWRERLAQVAEWHGQPALALAQWRHLALTRNNLGDWQALLRLAPGLFDHPTLILALRHEYEAGRLNDAGLMRLIQTYEAEADTDEAMTLLRQAYRQQPRRVLLEQEAKLAERMGQIADTMAALRRLSERHGARASEIRHLATLHIAQGDLAGAYRTLQQHQSIARDDRSYRALMADLAWRLQDKATAQQLYRSLHATGTLADHEAERLILLMNESSPQAASTVALRTWHTQRSPRFAALALSLLIQARDTVTARRLLDSLSPADLIQLEQQAGFLERRAEVARLEGHPERVIADLRRAIQLESKHTALQVNLLWALVEARQRDALTAEVARLRPRAQVDSTFWAPMGAALVTLDRPREAVLYFAKQANARRDDYLWHINYAQVLESAGQAHFAWRLRRHAWLQMRRAGKPAPRDSEAWLTQARLALQIAPADTGVQWLREALRQDRAARQDLSPEARELALVWLLSTEQHESARLWLTQQYAKQLAAPGWAEAALALNNHDTAALRRIAEGDTPDLPADTRAAAALQLREYALARQLAFDGLAQSPDSDTLHGQLTESRWLQQNRVVAAARHETLGSLESTALRTGAQWEVRPHLKLGLELTEHRLSSRDTTQLLKPPTNDLRLSLSAQLDHGNHETGLKLFVRKALEGIAGLQLDHQLRLDRRLRIGGALGFNLEADETAALKAGGVKDSLKLNADWQLSSRDYLLAEAAYNRYLGQDRAALGSGLTLALQAGHHLRIAYPDMTIKLLGNLARFDADTRVNGSITQLLPAGVGAMPGDTTQFGFGLGLGESVFEQPSRAFRPYATLDLLHASDVGWGYGIELGFVVSPTGDDWLRGRWRDGRARFAGDQDARLFELEYRHLF
ncbi:MAG: tetratricopeptide repeat protein [Thiobacillus sp.]